MDYGSYTQATMTNDSGALLFSKDEINHLLAKRTGLRQDVLDLQTRLYDKNNHDFFTDAKATTTANNNDASSFTRDDIANLLAENIVLGRRVSYLQKRLDDRKNGKCLVCIACERNNKKNDDTIYTTSCTCESVIDLCFACLQNNYDKVCNDCLLCMV